MRSYQLRANLPDPELQRRLREELNEQQQATILQNIPAGKMGDSDDISAGVLYLASDEAKYVTGQTLHINGGMAMI